MPLRLVSLDGGSDVVVDRAVVVVGRHPQCDARLDSIRVSRRHCCMTPDRGELVVRDLGSTNGIRINGQRVEMGRVRAGDELSIAHIRFRLENGHVQDPTVAGLSVDRNGDDHLHSDDAPQSPVPVRAHPDKAAAAAPAAAHKPGQDDSPLAAAVRGMLPAALADRCKIQVILQMEHESDVPAVEAQPSEEAVQPCPPDSSP